jgi:hypothetical protein
METKNSDSLDLNYHQMVERRDLSRAYANTMSRLIAMYQRQGDRQESIRKCAEEGKIAILEAMRIERLLSDDKTEILAA